jgi:hypothetical protein
MTDRLAPYIVEAKHPDDFVIDTIDLSPGSVAKVIADQAARMCVTCSTRSEVATDRLVGRRETP